MKKGFQALLDEANAEIKAISPQEAAEMAKSDDVTLVDIRDIRELNREGRINGAIHAPRGMLEFWVDPESPYHRDVFASGNTFVFFCAAGWRSALATKSMQEMGLEPVMHIEGGFAAWKEAELPINEPDAAKKS
ncbi:MAG: rhodanese-like domain-containing protein [Rhizobiaceae bacterium]